jgi:hypothetical protein
MRKVYSISDQVARRWASDWKQAGSPGFLPGWGLREPA